MKLIITLFLISISSVSGASDNTRAKVNYAGVKGDGVVFINIDQVITETLDANNSCSSQSINVPPTVNESVRNQILSVALTAYVAQKDIYIKTDGCVNGVPSITGTDSGWIHIYTGS